MTHEAAVALSSASADIKDGIKSAAIWIASVFTSEPKTLTATAVAYGYGQCVAAAKAKAEELEKLSEPYLFIELAWTGAGYIVTKDGRKVASNGYHVGVFYDGKIYCNMYPDGLPAVEWLLSFYGLGQEYVFLGPILVGKYVVIEFGLPFIF